MLVAMWMTRRPTTIRPDTPVGEAAALMARQRWRHLLVTDERAGTLRGIVSLHDLARAFPPDVNPLSASGSAEGPRRPVSEVMSVRPTTVRPSTPIEDAVGIMIARKFGALPVVQGQEVAGILTDSDVLRAFVELVGAAGETSAGTRSARITFDVSEGEDAVPFVVDIAQARQSCVASVLTMQHEGRRLVVARVVGGDIDGLVGAVWRSGHRVLSVLES